jgi:hypothetical protein
MWQQIGAVEDLTAARAAYDAGETIGGDQLRRRYRLKPQ